MGSLGKINVKEAYLAHMEAVNSTNRGRTYAVQTPNPRLLVLTQNFGSPMWSRAICNSIRTLVINKSGCFQSNLVPFFKRKFIPTKYKMLNLINNLHNYYAILLFYFLLE